MHTNIRAYDSYWRIDWFSLPCLSMAVCTLSVPLLQICLELVRKKSILLLDFVITSPFLLSNLNSRYFLNLTVQNAKIRWSFYVLSAQCITLQYSNISVEYFLSNLTSCIEAVEKKKNKLRSLCTLIYLWMEWGRYRGREGKQNRQRRWTGERESLWFVMRGLCLNFWGR